MCGNPKTKFDISYLSWMASSVFIDSCFGDLCCRRGSALLCVWVVFWDAFLMICTRLRSCILKDAMYLVVCRLVVWEVVILPPDHTKDCEVPRPKWLCLWGPYSAWPGVWCTCWWECYVGSVILCVLPSRVVSQLAVRSGPKCFFDSSDSDSDSDSFSLRLRLRLRLKFT